MYFFGNPPMQAHHNAVAADTHDSVSYMATLVNLFQKSRVFSVF
jgi:hypothetical protein